MKMSFELDSLTHVVQDTDAVLVDEAIDMSYTLLRSVFPFLTLETMAARFQERYEQEEANK